MSSAEAMDMMTCLEDICGIFAVESDEVAQVCATTISFLTYTDCTADGGG